MMFLTMNFQLKKYALTSTGLVLSLVLSFSLPAAGQNAEDDSIKRSKEFFERGIILFKAGDYKGAYENFQSSYSLHPHIKLKYNIGVCLFYMKEYAAAGNELEAFLIKEGGNLESQMVQKALESLKKIRSKVGLLYIEAAVVGTEIRIDDEEIGKSPFPSGIYVDPGAYEIAALGSSGQVLKKKVYVEAGDSQVINIILSDGGGIETENEIKIKGPGFAKETEAKISKKTGRKKAVKAILYAALALAAASAVGGGISGGIALNKVHELDDLDRKCISESCNTDPVAHDDYVKKGDSLYHDAQIAGKLSTGLFVVSGAAAVSSLILFFVAGPFKKEKNKQTALYPLFVIGENECLLKLNF